MGFFWYLPFSSSSTFFSASSSSSTPPPLTHTHTHKMSLLLLKSLLLMVVVLEMRLASDSPMPFQVTWIMLCHKVAELVVVVLVLLLPVVHRLLQVSWSYDFVVCVALCVGFVVWTLELVECIFSLCTVLLGRTRLRWRQHAVCSSAEEVSSSACAA